MPISAIFLLKSLLPCRLGTPNSLQLFWAQHNSSGTRKKGSVTIEHCKRALLTYLVSQSDFLHWIAFALLLISSFLIGHPQDLNSSSRLWVWHDLPAQVWGTSMVKRFLSFMAVAGLVFPSIMPGILGWFDKSMSLGVLYGPRLGFGRSGRSF